MHPAWLNPSFKSPCLAAVAANSIEQGMVPQSFALRGSEVATVAVARATPANARRVLQAPTPSIAPAATTAANMTSAINRAARAQVAGVADQLCAFVVKSRLVALRHSTASYKNVIRACRDSEPTFLGRLEADDTAPNLPTSPAWEEEVPGLHANVPPATLPPQRPVCSLLRFPGFPAD